MTFLTVWICHNLISRKNWSGGKTIKFQQGQALTSHFESFWSIVACKENWEIFLKEFSEAGINALWRFLIKQHPDYFEVWSFSHIRKGVSKVTSKFNSVWCHHLGKEEMWERGGGRFVPENWIKDVFINNTVLCAWLKV